jgi:hypothetical protein
VTDRPLYRQIVEPQLRELATAAGLRAPWAITIESSEVVRLHPDDLHDLLVFWNSKVVGA